METQTQDEQNEKNPEPSSLESQQQTPPINQPPDSPTKPDSNDTLLQLLREQNGIITKQQEELSRIRSDLNAPPVRTQEELTQDFYKDPVGVLDSRIEAALRKTIAPLEEVAKMFKSTTRIDELVSQFKNDARFSSGWNSKLESYVRQQAATIPIDQLNESLVGTIVLNGIGMQSLGLLEKDSAPQAPPPPKNNPNPPTPNNQMIPPYMRPSPNLPDSSNNANQKKLRPLTELEARMARERGQTQEQYLAWLEEPASSVTSSNIGRPIPPTGGK